MRGRAGEVVIPLQEFNTVRSDTRRFTLGRRNMKEKVRPPTTRPVLEALQLGSGASLMPTVCRRLAALSLESLEREWLRPGRRPPASSSMCNAAL